MLGIHVKSMSRVSKPSDTELHVQPSSKYLMVNVPNVSGKIHSTTLMVISFVEEFGDEGTFIVQSYGEV